MKNVLVAFNGTGNKDEDDNDFDTNVTKMVEAYIGDVYYQDGVGTGGWLDKLLGGLCGFGGRGRVKNTIKYVVKNDPDIIDVVGFSRGAALAVDFCNKVGELGYKVRCLMVYDVVASFGLAGNDINIGYDLGCPTNVKYMYHAMSLDEQRECFPLTRLTGAKEVWFSGYHSDIGGGNGNVGLNSIPLSWMFKNGCQAGVVWDLVLWNRAEYLCNPKSEKIKPTDLIELSYSDSRNFKQFDVVYGL